MTLSSIPLTDEGPVYKHTSIPLLFTFVHSVFISILSSFPTLNGQPPIPRGPE